MERTLKLQEILVHKDVSTQANSIVQLTARVPAEGRIPPVRNLDSQVSVELR